jgi:hypothetical protein
MFGNHRAMSVLPSSTASRCQAVRSPDDFRRRAARRIMEPECCAPPLGIGPSVQGPRRSRSGRFQAGAVPARCLVSYQSAQSGVFSFRQLWMLWYMKRKTATLQGDTAIERVWPHWDDVIWKMRLIFPFIYHADCGAELFSPGCCYPKVFQFFWELELIGVHQN